MIARITKAWIAVIKKMIADKTQAGLAVTNQNGIQLGQCWAQFLL